MIYTPMWTLIKDVIKIKAIPTKLDLPLQDVDYFHDFGASLSWLNLTPIYNEHLIPPPLQ